MERSIDVLAVVLFGVLGLSHILQPAAWVECFILLRGKGATGAFVDKQPYGSSQTGTCRDCTGRFKPDTAIS